jgi:hypothetical protein
VSSWTDSQITIQGFQGAFGQGSYTLNVGDQVEVLVWNAQTGAGPATSTVTVSKAGPLPAFFNGANLLGNNVWYLQFPDTNLFGYYSTQLYPIIYHYDMGFESVIDGGNGAVYFYDFATTHWWYTTSSLFPYMYDFTLQSWLYYFPATTDPGHYTSTPRYFSVIATGKIITL